MPATAQPRRIVHQKAKGPIDPALGIKIRELRMARGLTQAELAGKDFSKGFISLLETGRTRASLRAAHILAGRLGVEVSDLLSAPAAAEQDQEFTLLRAEQELRAGGHQVAEQIASQWTKKSRGLMRARFQRLHGRALLLMDRSAEAIKLLDQALASFRSFGAKDLAARTMFDLARAHMRSDAQGEAIRYALDAEHALHVEDLIDKTLELDIHRLLSTVYLRLGDVASADLRTERARALAEDIADPGVLAKLYASLALTRFQGGDREAALAYARKSLDGFEGLGERERVAEAWNTLGWIHIQRGEFDKAAECLDRSSSMAKVIGDALLERWVQASRAELAMSRKRFDEARRLAEAAAQSASGELRAIALLLRAQAIAAADASTTAIVRRAFEDAIAAHTSEPPRVRARAHRLYADALAARKQLPEAYEQARKALDLAGLRPY
jgi:tetratricopeptide (TPR) repeat protein